MAKIFHRGEPKSHLESLTNNWSKVTLWKPIPDVEDVEDMKPKWKNKPIYHQKIPGQIFWEMVGRYGSWDSER